MEYRSKEEWRGIPIVAVSLRGRAIGVVAVGRVAVGVIAVAMSQIGSAAWGGIV
jgi:hypothetical protein